MSKSEKNMVPHFYIIWKMLKHPPIGRPPVAGKNWILTPASTFAEHFLKEFYRKFDGILTDGLSLVKRLETTKFDEACFVFTRDFKSLYTNIPTEYAINSSKELVVEFDNVIKNTDFILEFFNVILENSQRIFSTNFRSYYGDKCSAILANIYLA